MATLVKRFSVLAFVLALSACGGGGGGSSSTASSSSGSSTSSGGTATTTGSTCATGTTCVEVDGVAYTCGDETKMATYCVAFRTDNGTLYKSDPSIAVTATWTDWGGSSHVITNEIKGLPNGDQVGYNSNTDGPNRLYFQYGDGRGSTKITFSGVGDGNWVTVSTGFNYWVKKTPRMYSPSGGEIGGATKSVKESCGIILRLSFPQKVYESVHSV